jgi:hypothetical protein
MAARQQDEPDTDGPVRTQDRTGTHTGLTSIAVLWMIVGAEAGVALPVQLPALFGQDVLAGPDGLVWFADFPALLVWFLRYSPRYGAGSEFRMHGWRTIPVSQAGRMPALHWQTPRAPAAGGPTWTREPGSSGTGCRCTSRM